MLSDPAAKNDQDESPRVVRVHVVRRSLESRSIQQMGNKIGGRMLRAWVCRNINLATREVQFIWHVLPGAGTIDFEEHIQIYLHGLGPQSLEERIVLLSMFNDVDDTPKKGMQSDVCTTPKKWQSFR